jgi:glutamate racemase
MDFVEREELDSPALDRYLDELFFPFIGQDIDSAVLGCTHYLFLRDSIVRHLPTKTKIIDSNQGVVRQLKSKLIQDELLADRHESGEVTFLSTGGPEKIPQMERMLRHAQEI